MAKPTIGVFFGSRSAEHDVSIITALGAVIKPLEALGDYTVVPIYIANTGVWYSHPSLADIKTFQAKDFNTQLQKLKPVAVEFGAGKLILKPSGLRAKPVVIDIAFPATHGTYGEDGALMGVFEMAGVPYVGCDVAASAVAMNKILSKWVAQTHKIEIAPFISFKKQDVSTDLDGLVNSVGKRFKQLPLFVKPARLGSSIGITRVDDLNDLGNAIEVAAHYDEDILVEEGIHNLIEVTIPVMGNHDVAVANVEKPLVQAQDFFDFEQKYIGQGKKGGNKSAQQGAQGYSELPAKLPKAIYEECETVARDIYQAIGCSGIARVDLLIDSKAKKVYFNEINPLPGSLYLHNWNSAGMSSTQVVAELIRLAQERAVAKNELATTFDSSFIGQF